MTMVTRRIRLMICPFQFTRIGSGKEKAGSERPITNGTAISATGEMYGTIVKQPWGANRSPTLRHPRHRFYPVNHRPRRLVFVQNNKTPRGRKTAPGTFGEVSGWIFQLWLWAAGLLRRRLGPFAVASFENSQSRYKIWSVQKRSSRCSDLFRVANSSF